jgi:hypothetical protein
MATLKDFAKLSSCTFFDVDISHQGQGGERFRDDNADFLLKALPNQLAAS